MIPVGYMAKRVAVHPEWLAAAERVTHVYSVSGHISDDFADFIQYWAHNGWWFFDSPQVLLDVARRHAIDLGGTTLFFYEAYDRQFDAGRWVPFEPEASFTTDVVPPAERTLEGWDVVTFSQGNGAECSPLSCNGLATDVETNPHCLLPSLERARELLDAGAFENTEPGPYRVFSVYSTPWPAQSSGGASCTQ